MKKVLFIAILALFLAVSPTKASAQNVTELQQTLIETLQAMVVQLTEQLNNLIAEQRRQSEIVKDYASELDELREEYEIEKENTKKDIEIVKKAVIKEEPVKIPVEISVGDSFCENDRLTFPIAITGTHQSALLRIYSESGSYDGNQKLKNGPQTQYGVFGNVKDLKAETSSYGNPADNPFLNNVPFFYDIKVYDLPYERASKKIIERKRGEITIPSCE